MSTRKLTPTQVQELRQRYATTPETNKTLAADYGISHTAVGGIIRNITYPDPDYTPPDPATRRRRKGRKADTSTSAKLTWESVRDIRERYTANTRETTRSLGEEYGVSPHAISEIIRNTAWTDPDYTPPVTGTGSRARSGEDTQASKLTWKAVREIRERYSTGEVTGRALGEEYGITNGALSKIVNNILWRDDAYTPPLDRNPRKLTWPEVHAIREQYAAGNTTLRSLGLEYGIHLKSVSLIIRNTAWNDPDYTPPKKRSTR